MTMALPARNSTSVKQLLLDNIQAKKHDDTLAILQSLETDDLRGDIGIELLHFSVRHSNDIAVQHLINLGVNVDAHDKCRTPLLTALHNSDFKTIQTLLSCKANIYYYVEFGGRLIEVALSSDSVDLSIKKAFLLRVKSDSSNDSSLTAEKLLSIDCRIYHAALLGDVEVLRIMLSRGCLVSDSDRSTGKTALHVAVLMKNLKCIKLLLRNGANVNAKDKIGSIPLALACNYGESEEEYEILNYLLDQGSKIRAIYYGTYETQEKYILAEGKKAIIQTLISRKKVNFRTRDFDGRTSLHYISKNIELFKDQSFIEDLKQRRINVNILDHCNNNALHEAADLKNLRATLFLLENGANVNQQNWKDYSALYLATKCRLYPTMNTSEKRNVYNLIELLLQYGADPQSVTETNLTVIDEILWAQNFDLAKPILAYLALHVDRGHSVIELIHTKINSNEILEKEFELCQKDLQEIKTIRLNDSITAFNLTRKKRIS